MSDVGQELCVPGPTFRLFWPPPVGLARFSDADCLQHAVSVGLNELS